MGGDDELCVSAVAVLGEQAQQFELARRRQRGLRLVQEIQSGYLIAAAEIGEKPLAPRAQGQLLPSVVPGLPRIDLRDVVDEFRPLSKAFGTENSAPYRPPGEGHIQVAAQGSGRQGQGGAQQVGAAARPRRRRLGLRVGSRRRSEGRRRHRDSAHAGPAPFRLRPQMKAAPPRYGLDQRGFARAVLADEEGHALREAQFLAVLEGRDAEGVDTPIGELVPPNPNVLEPDAQSVGGLSRGVHWVMRLRLPTLMFTFMVRSLPGCAAPVAGVL
jgi:hypothetical protein